MGQGIQFLDIILFAMVALFIILRLRSVLGQRGGHEQPPREPEAGRDRFSRRRDDKGDNVVRLPGREGGEEVAQVRNWDAGDPLGAGLTRIQIADPSFDPDRFSQGATAAYEMIVSAFAKGDRDELRPLLSDEVYRSFESVIDQREKDGLRVHTEIAEGRDVDLLEAEMDGSIARVTVKFVSDMISYTQDESGVVTAGDPTTPREVTDIWTFSRDTASRDPNWLLAATRSTN